MYNCYNCQRHIASAKNTTAMAFRQLLLVEPGTEWPTHFAWTPRRIYTASLWHRSTGPYNHDLFKRLGFSRRSRWVWKSIATGANGQKEDSVMQLPSFPCKFDRAVIVAQWYNIRLETLETCNPAYFKRFGQAWQALVTWLPHQYPRSAYALWSWPLLPRSSRLAQMDPKGECSFLRVFSAQPATRLCYSKPLSTFKLTFSLAIWL